ncbi:MAG: NADH-quinone oxidoreductase subunit J [Bacteroidota bacterium]
MALEQILFFALAFIAVASALLVVTRRNPVVSVIYLVVNFFALAGLYLILSAQFIAAIQIIVYAGAIMVLFLFVIMLLNLGDEQKLTEHLNYRKAIGVVFVVALATEIVSVFFLKAGSGLYQQSPKAANIGTAEGVGRALFTKFFFPFEITSILLVAAIVGAIVLAKKRLD